MHEPVKKKWKQTHLILITMRIVFNPFGLTRYQRGELSVKTTKKNDEHSNGRCAIRDFYKWVPEIGDAQ